MLVLITPLKITMISTIITALKTFNILYCKSQARSKKVLMKQKGYKNEPKY